MCCSVWSWKINNCSHFTGLSLFCDSPCFSRWERFPWKVWITWFNLYLDQLQDTGKLNVSYFRFDINDATGELDANRPVPFRLTPNISEFLTTIGVSGPLTASMIAVARCFAQPNFKVTLSWQPSFYGAPVVIFSFIQFFPMQNSF